MASCEVVSNGPLKMDEAVAQFVAITNSGAPVAEQYLKLSDGNLEQAMQLFYDSGAIDLQEPEPPRPRHVEPPQRSHQTALRTHGTHVDEQGVIHVDSDEDEDDEDGGDRARYMGHGDNRGRGAQPDPGQPAGAGTLPRASPPNALSGTEDDEAIARRMQEELYAGLYDADGVRAPIAPTRETLVGPGADWDDEGIGHARMAVDAQIAARRERVRELASQRHNRPGIFNQRPTGTSSVWDESSAESSVRRRELAQATGGASETSSKASMLAEMYRPPIEIISRLPWDLARQEGKSAEKWLLVNIQDPSIFDCQVLNRDVWKDGQIRDTIKEHFVFLQYNKGDPRGFQYENFYFKDKDEQNAYPHIAIVDPRTGEQVKVWAGPPVPKAADFLMQLHEFLDRYSLRSNAKNPIGTRRAEPVKAKPKAPVNFDHMTEEQMLEMAMQNSLVQPVAGSEQGPDEVETDAAAPTEGKGKGKGKQRMVDAQSSGPDESGTTAAGPNGSERPSTAGGSSPFASISSSRPHAEPAADAPNTTRIQFRHSGGRIIRRFGLTEPVRRIYEWLKAEPLPGKEGVDLELVSSGRNLFDQRDETIADAGLQNQTVMIEFLEG